MKYTRKQRIKHLTETALMAVVICVCSWITIPFTVPFTMQVFGVAMSLLLLGGIYGTISIGLYLLMGFIGIPVFSGFTGGIGHIIGPTGGYIIGFLFMGIIYLVFEQKKNASSKYKFMILLIGLVACYFIGTLWFMVVSEQKSLKHFFSCLAICVLPYLIPDCLKLLLSVYVSNRVKRFI